ncbi:MAG: cell division protein ZapE [Pseudomonadota bacterium]|nr:cell division protein ZapE [Pseudomonadota bacterium]
MEKSPLELYKARLVAGEIQEDAHQKIVIDRLELLHQELSKKRVSPGFSLFKKLLFLAEEDKKYPRCLYIYGPPGRGKSMLMDLFFETAPVWPRKRVHVHPFMQAIHERLHLLRTGDDSGDISDPLGRLARLIAEESSLICFDEFQVEAIADAMIVRRLFEKILSYGVTVVATSNTAPQHLYEGGLQRERFVPFIDLIFEKFDILELGRGNDYRRDRLKSVGVWHYPLDESSRGNLEAAFDQLTNGQTGEPTSLTVQGRSLLIERQAAGVAFFTFEELCNRPLGPSDYGAIACSFQTILISDIPVLTASDRNAAKRFATLIETLYEQKTKIVCSAAALPDELYREGDGAALFGRVASRLEEMQAEDYLAEAHRPATSKTAA